MGFVLIYFLADFVRITSGDLMCTLFNLSFQFFLFSVDLIYSYYIYYGQYKM